MSATLALRDPMAFRYIASMANKALVKKSDSRIAMRERYAHILLLFCFSLFIS